MAKTIIGVVTSNKTDKTIVVTVHTRKTHPLYRKQYTVTSKFMAHDEKNEARPATRWPSLRPARSAPASVISWIRSSRSQTARADSLAVTKSDDEGQNRACNSKAKANDEEDRGARRPSHDPAGITSERLR